MRHFKCQNHVPKRRLKVYACACVSVWGKSFQDAYGTSFVKMSIHANFSIKWISCYFSKNFEFLYTIPNGIKWTEPLSIHMSWSGDIFFIRMRKKWIELINLGSREKTERINIYFDHKWANGQNNFDCLAAFKMGLILNASHLFSTQWIEQNWIEDFTVNSPKNWQQNGFKSQSTSCQKKTEICEWNKIIATWMTTNNTLNREKFGVEYVKSSWNY